MAKVRSNIDVSIAALKRNGYVFWGRYSKKSNAVKTAAKLRALGKNSGRKARVINLLGGDNWDVFVR